MGSHCRVQESGESLQPPKSVVQSVRRSRNRCLAKLPPAEGQIQEVHTMIELPSRKLADLLATHGPKLCEHPRRCEELLLEECPQFPRDVRMLTRAQEHGIARDLRASPPGTPWQP